MATLVRNGQTGGANVQYLSLTLAGVAAGNALVVAVTAYEPGGEGYPNTVGSNIPGTTFARVAGASLNVGGTDHDGASIWIARGVPAGDHLLQIEIGPGSYVGFAAAEYAALPPDLISVGTATGTGTAPAATAAQSTPAGAFALALWGGTHGGGQSPSGATAPAGYYLVEQNTDGGNVHALNLSHRDTLPAGTQSVSWGTVLAGHYWAGLVAVFGTAAATGVSGAASFPEAAQGFAATGSAGVSGAASFAEATHGFAGTGAAAVSGAASFADAPQGFAATEAASVVVEAGGDIAAAAAAAPEGAVIRVRAGVYREQTVTAKTGQTFIGDPGAVLNGARLVTAFTQETVGGVAYWVMTGATKPTWDRTGAFPCSPGLRCGRSESVFIDDQPLLHADSLAGVAPGRFYLDDAAAKIYFRDDPAGKKVEVSSTFDAFRYEDWGPSSNVTIRGFVVEKYANSAQYGAIKAHAGWRVEDNDIRLNHGVGVSFTSTCQVLGNRIYRNGQMGYGGTGNGGLLQGNEIHRNGGWAGVQPGWEGGGGKVAESDGFTARANHSHDNVGSGLWTDVNNVNTLYEDNVVENNSDQGIWHEISYAATIRRNTCRGNGHGYSEWLYGAQILIAASKNCEVYENDVDCTAAGNGICIINQARGDGSLGKWEATNNRVHHNDIRFAGSDPTATWGFDDDTNDPVYRAAHGNAFDHNRYHADPAQPRWSWITGDYGFAAWQSTAGQDANGSVVAAATGDAMFQAAPDAFAAGGSAEVSGAAAFADAGESLAASAAAEVAGAAAFPADGEAFAGVGDASPEGAAAFAEADGAFAAGGDAAVTGDAAFTDAPQTLTAYAEGQDPVGDAAFAEAPGTFAAAGDAAVSGDAAFADAAGDMVGAGEAAAAGSALFPAAAETFQAWVEADALEGAAAFLEADAPFAAASAALVTADALFADAPHAFLAAATAGTAPEPPATGAPSMPVLLRRGTRLLRSGGKLLRRPVQPALPTGEAPPPPAPTNYAVHGIFIGNNAADLPPWETWIGKQADAVLAFTNEKNDWGDVDPGWMLGSQFLGGTGRRIVWTIPMFPASLGLQGLRDAGSGAFDSRWRDYAGKCLNHRSGDSGPIFVRTFWELGGEWYPWTGWAKSDPAAMVAAFRRWYTVWKGVSPRFKMCYDFEGDRTGAETWYPGSAYCDVLCQDLYWQVPWFGENSATAWNYMLTRTRGINWMLQFNRDVAGNKPIAVPEWGVPAGYDASAYLASMKQWMVDTQIVFHCYWDSDSAYRGRLSGNRDPASSNAYKTQFGPAAARIPAKAVP